MLGCPYFWKHPYTPSHINEATELLPPPELFISKSAVAPARYLPPHHPWPAEAFWPQILTQCVVRDLILERWRFIPTNLVTAMPSKDSDEVSMLRVQRTKTLRRTTLNPAKKHKLTSWISQWTSKSQQSEQTWSPILFWASHHQVTMCSGRTSRNLG